MLTEFTNAISRAGNGFLDMLPICPFYRVQEITVSNEILSWLSWFIPFDAMVGLINAWLAAVSVWYVAKKAMRWAKIIS
jgi:hypothetical protein